MSLSSHLLVRIELYSDLVYRVTKGDGSGYNRKNGVQLNTKSKVEGAITNEEYRSPEAPGVVSRMWWKKESACPTL